MRQYRLVAALAAAVAQAGPAHARRRGRSHSRYRRGLGIARPGPALGTFDFLSCTNAFNAGC